MRKRKHRVPPNQPGQRLARARAGRRGPDSGRSGVGRPHLCESPSGQDLLTCTAPACSDKALGDPRSRGGGHTTLNRAGGGEEGIDLGAPRTH